ncbi:MAG: EAL domain-containing protein [Candidatus Dactylopiibacterium sp.]|nr:EAL domain-containing protein [Candidatus Dactylopiibacterium sp.]
MADHVDEAGFLRRLAVSIRMAMLQEQRLALVMLGAPARLTPRDQLSQVRAAVRVTDCVARVDADRYAVLLEVDTLAGALCASGKVAGLFGAQAGLPAALAVFPDDGEDAAGLWQALAEAFAQSRALRAGIVRVARAHVTRADARQGLAAELPEALRRRALHLCYQPTLGLHSGAIAGLEALARWQHPRRGLLVAADFIAEVNTPAAAEIFNLAMFEQALLQLRAWHAAGLRLSLAVNLSAPMLGCADLADQLLVRLQRSEVPLACVTLELPDAALAELPDAALRNLFTLAAAGLCLCIDDFGCGTASMFALRDLPVEMLKMDVGRVGGLGDDASDAAIVESVLTLGRRLGKRVVAKGVENAAQLERLVALGCEYVQGRHVAPPLAAQEVARWCQLRRARQAGEAAPWADDAQP